MALKLKSVLRSQQSTLLFKALIFWGFLMLVYIGNFGLVPILFFLVMALNTPPSFIVAAFYAFLFYIILGLKNLIFINRANWHQALHLLLFYALFIHFWNIGDEATFLLRLVGIFAASLLLIREFFKVVAVDSPKRRVVASWVLALLITEAVWVISWLPIGFLNSSPLASLIVFTLINLTLQ